MVTPNDVRESFPILEDGTSAGASVTKTLEGDSAVGKVGPTVFAFKDANGNVVLPQLDAQGRLPVQMDGQGTRLRNRNAVPGGVLTGAASGYGNFQTITSINLTASKNYGDMKGHVSCRRGALFQLLYQDVGSTVVLDEAMVDAGQYTTEIGLGPQEDYFSVPASAVSPQFVVRAGNFQVQSDVHASLAVLQF